jgi:nucleoid DNA-binding protein
MATNKLTAVKDRMTKAQIISEIADATEVSKKDVKAVLAALSDQAQRHLKSRGCGEFMVPELGVKLKRVNKPATKARKGINPFTGEPMMFKAKKASTSVRAVALKACKDMASS